MSKFLSHFLIFLLFSPPLFGQKLDEERKLVQGALQSVYNAEINHALGFIQKLEKRIPEHPSVPLLKALCLKWKYESKFRKNSELDKTIKYLEQCTDASEKQLEKNPIEPEMNFLALSGFGFMAEQYYRSGSKYKAIGKAKSAYQYIKKGFSKCEAYPEFYYTTALYNYYRVVFPERHILYRPFMWFFPEGDREKGLAQLHTASQKSLLSRTEAYYYMVHILMRYECQAEKSFPYARFQYERYPDNSMFATSFAENAVMTGNWKSAREVSMKFALSNDPEIKMLAEWLNGEITERKENNYEKALLHYSHAERLNPDRHKMLNYYLSLVNLGKARCLLATGRLESARKCLEQVKKGKKYFRTENEIKKLEEALQQLRRG